MSVASSTCSLRRRSRSVSMVGHTVITVAQDMCVLPSAARVDGRQAISSPLRRQDAKNAKVRQDFYCFCVSTDYRLLSRVRLVAWQGARAAFAFLPLPSLAEHAHFLPHGMERVIRSPYYLGVHCVAQSPLL